MKQFNFIFVIILLIGINNSLFSQEKIKTESDTHIFWQPDRLLTIDDFKGNGSNNAKNIKYCDDLGLCTVACVGLFGVLDIPKKKKNRGKLIEKAYFALAFEKATSYIIKNDSLGIEKQKLVFDIYEISARYARKELAHYQDSVGGYGILSIMFNSVKANAKEMHKKMTGAFTKDIYIEHRKGAYEEWKKEIAKLLEESKEFETKPDDCYRFVKMIPIDENYIMPETVIGNLF